MPQTDQGHNPPSLYNLEAERALVGTILRDNRALLEIGTLHAGDFHPDHQRIVRAVVAIINAGAVASDVSVRNRIVDEAERATLSRIMRESDYVLDTVSTYAAIVKAHAVRRAVHGAGLTIAKLARDARSDEFAEPDALVLEAQRALAELDSIVGEGEAWKSAGEIAAEAVERAHAGLARGISTGLPTLDDCTGGGRPGSLWVLGGATSMGKSIGGQQLAVNVAKQGYGVAYVHLEMDVDEVGLRLASALAFRRDRLAKGEGNGNPYYLSAVRQNLSDQQWEWMREAARDVAPSLQIYVDDRPGRTVTQIESAVRRLFQRMEMEGVTPGLIVVDHEGLIAAEGKHPSELEAARARANRLKDMAKRLGVWTVALSQITKEGSKAEGEERLPTALDLNYGSALSQAAHVVILIHRKAYYAERKPHASRSEEDHRMTRSRETTLVVDKARGGQRKHVEALMDVASAVLIETGEGGAE